MSPMEQVAKNLAAAAAAAAAGRQVAMGGGAMFAMDEGVSRAFKHIGGIALALKVDEALN